MVTTMASCLVGAVVLCSGRFVVSTLDVFEMVVKLVGFSTQVRNQPALLPFMAHLHVKLPCKAGKSMVWSGLGSLNGGGRTGGPTHRSAPGLCVKTSYSW